MVQNGSPQLCIDALAPHEDDVFELDQNARAIAFDIEDTKKKHRHLVLCVVVAGASNKQYNEAKRIYGKLGADVTKDDSFRHWAKDAVKELSK